MFGCGRRFQAPPAVNQLFPSARTADLLEDGETLDSDDDSLPSVKQMPASSKRAKRAIDLTGDDDGDGEGGDGNFTEVSWLRTTRTVRHLMRLIPPSLIDRTRVAGQLHSPFTALSDKVTGTYCRRPHNAIYGGHTWQEENTAHFVKAMLHTYLPSCEVGSWIPYILSRGWSKKVLIFGPSNALVHPVIPAVLLKAEYSRLPRVWFLQGTGDPWGEKMESLTEGHRPRMFIRAKSVLYGNPSEDEYQSQLQGPCIGRGMWIHGRLAAAET